MAQGNPLAGYLPIAEWRSPPSYTIVHAVSRPANEVDRSGPLLSVALIPSSATFRQALTPSRP
jgi:hypothetical protein